MADLLPWACHQESDSIKAERGAPSHPRSFEHSFVLCFNSVSLCACSCACICSEAAELQGGSFTATRTGWQTPTAHCCLCSFISLLAALPLCYAARYRLAELDLKCPNHNVISTQQHESKIRQKWSVLTKQIACKTACLERFESKLNPITDWGRPHWKVAGSGHCEGHFLPISLWIDWTLVPRLAIPLPCLAHWCISIYYCFCKQVCHAASLFPQPKGTSQCHYR